MNEKDYFLDLDERHGKLWPPEVPTEPVHPHGVIPLSDYLRTWARERPEQAVYIFYGRRITFAQLDALSDRCAALLHAHGVGAGDRVAVMMGNCPQFAIAFFGILKLGAVHVPVNPMYQRAELLHQLLDAGPKVVIASDACADLILAVQAEAGLQAVFTTAQGEMLPPEPEIDLPQGLDAPHTPRAGTLSFLAALDACNEPAPPHTPDLDAPAALNYTGGTTGLPKGCVHTQGDMIYTAAAYFASHRLARPGRRGVDPDDVALSFVPMFWVAGENGGLLLPVFSGGTLVLLARWSAVAVMQAIDRYRVRRCFMLVDNAIEIMRHADVAQYDLRSLTATGVSSFVQKISVDLRNRWRQLTGATMAESAWGMTETHTSDTFTTDMQQDDQDLLGRPGFVGLPMPGTRIKICDFDTGALMPHGQEGEIVVRTPSLFKGYWQRPDATAQAIRAGWFHTGDIGTYDEHGYLHYLGRRKEMLKVKGMSVFPTEVEVLICFHPDVLDAAVVGRPDADKGQVPVAFVRLRAGATSGAGDIEAWCRDQMAIYKIPEVRIIDAWPMTTTGKIKKHALQERLLAEMAGP